VNNVERQQAAAIKFEQQASKIHNGFYDYSKVVYLGCKVKVKIGCPTHGTFEQIPNAHLTGYGCRQCGRDQINAATAVRVANNLPELQRLFIARSNDVHQGRYDYSKVEYKNAHTVVEIGCPDHGLFAQLPINHYVGRGCPRCGAESWVGGYNDEMFMLHPELKEKPATLYIIEVRHGGTKFIKIGITVQEVTDRLYRLHTHGLSFDILHTWRTTLWNAYIIEQSIKTECRDDRYYPAIVFAGYTECFRYKQLDRLVYLIKQDLL
jgi:hypothetical protein